MAAAAPAARSRMPAGAAYVAPLVLFMLLAFNLPIVLMLGWSIGAPPDVLAHYAQVFRPIATFWLVMCLLAAAGSAIRSFLIRRKFDQQTSLEDIRKLSWQQFEMIVGEAFRRLGYRVMENGGGGADGGIDLVLDREGQRFLVQCKQWRVLKVGVKPIRELAGVMSAKGVRDGFFVTSGTYTKEARDFAEEAGISLVDGDSLQRMVRDVR